MKRKSRNRVLSALLPLALLGAAAGIFFAQFFADNKYNGRTPPRTDGAAVVAADGVYALTEGWDVFAGLLSPAETRTAEPAARGVTIGAQPGLAAFAGKADGSATYRIFLACAGGCALYLPEVYTSAAVYADGELLGQTGDPAAGEVLVRDAVYPLGPGGMRELVVQVTAGGHYYGGIYYPPLAGGATAIARVIAARTAFYAAAVAIILCMVLLALPLLRYGGQKTRLPFLLLCVFTALSLLYPFVTAAGTALPALLFALTDVAAALALLFALTLAARLAGCQNSRAFLCGGLPLALGLTLLSAVMPPLMLLLPELAAVYGYIVSGARLLIGCCLAAFSAVGFGKAWKRGGAGFTAALTLAGGIVYALFVIAGVAAIGFFEPLTAFWFEETGALFLALVFGACMFARSLRVVRENRRLNKDLAAEVARQTEVITELFEERKKLLRSVSHDLKTPVTAIGTYAEALLAHGGKDEETRRGLTVIMQRLADFAARYGVLEELEAETPAVPAPLCLNEFVRTWTDDCRADAEMDGAELAAEVCREKLTVLADRDKLARILENLVFNAVSFTPAGGRITVSLTRKGGEAALAVADTGAGIAPEALPHIFEPYYSGRAESGGRGLGLFIVRTLAAALGGTVSVRSAPGKGAVFTVALPLAPGDRPPEI